MYHAFSERALLPDVDATDVRESRLAGAARLDEVARGEDRSAHAAQQRRALVLHRRRHEHACALGQLRAPRAQLDEVTCRVRRHAVDDRLEYFSVGVELLDDAPLE